MFKTARFKVHNPSRHKSTVLWYALTRYHQTLKDLLEKALSVPRLAEVISELDKKGKLRPNKYKLSKVLYAIAPKNWELAPLRDYLIGDAIAMLMSHLGKVYKGVNESNPPTMPSLAPMTEAEYNRAYRDFIDPEAQPEMKAQHREKIDSALARGETHVAKQLNTIYLNWACSRVAGQLLRRLEGPLPRPIEFTRNEFSRGCLLAHCDGNYYFLLRLFTQGHRYHETRILKDGFVDCKTGESLAGKRYAGLILPLELGREFHEREYLAFGKIQSAKLVVQRRKRPRQELRNSPSGSPAGAPVSPENFDFYLHAAFEFTPEPVETVTYLGVDRGAVRIGAATLIDGSGALLQSGFDLDGKAFSEEMHRREEQIRQLQMRGKQKSPRFSLRGKRADMILGEYANRIVQIARENRSQIVLEAIRGVTMGRFLKQSQFAKLKTMIAYKAERVGLPAPIEVPAAFTSQTCAECGHRDPANRPKTDAGGKRVQDIFHCVECGYQANADSNASRIITLRGLHQMANGGRFRKFDDFQRWLKDTIGRDGAAELPAAPVVSRPGTGRTGE